MNTRVSSNTDLERGIADFLRREHPAAYCDGCLALAVGVDITSAQRVAAALAGPDAEWFERGEAECEQCARVLPVTRAR